MRKCECGNEFPTKKLIDGKIRNLQNRTKCLSCQPFGEHQHQKLTDEERRAGKAAKVLRYYHKYKEEYGIDPVRAIREKKKLEIISILGGCCQICGYNKCARNLAFHHLSNKKFGISSRAFQYKIETIIKEVRKCVLVCHNCHGEIHDGLIDKSLIVRLNQVVMELLPP